MTLGQLSEKVKGELFGRFVGASKTATEQIRYKHQPLLGKCHLLTGQAITHIFTYMTKIRVTLVNSHETSWRRSQSPTMSNDLMAVACLSHVNKLHRERGKTSMLDNCGEGPQQSHLAPPLSQGWSNNKTGLNMGAGSKQHKRGLLGMERLQKTLFMKTRVCYNIRNRGRAALYKEQLLLKETLPTLNTFPKAPSPNSPIMSHISSGFSSLRTCSYCFFFFSAPNLNILRKLKNDILNPGSFN